MNQSQKFKVISYYLEGQSGKSVLEDEDMGDTSRGDVEEFLDMCAETLTNLVSGGKL
jgi:hypothetical protein